MCLAHPEEESIEREEEDETEDPDGKDGVMEEFMVCLTWAGEGCQSGGEVLLPLQQPQAPHPQLPIGDRLQGEYTVIPQGGDRTRRKEAWTHQMKTTMPKNPQEEGSQGVI